MGYITDKYLEDDFNFTYSEMNDDIAKDAMSESRGFLGNLFAKWFGTGLTTQQQQQNAIAAREAQESRRFDMLKMLWQEDMYNQYYSPEAQMKSQRAGMDALGVNPALMYGGSMPSGGSAPSPASGSAAASQSGLDSGSPSDLISTIMQVIGFKTQLDNVKSQTNKNNADANRASADAGKINVEKEIAEINKTFTERANQANLDKIASEIKVNEKNVEIGTSVIKLNESNIQVNGRKMSYLEALTSLSKAQEAESVSRTIYNNLNSDKIRAFLPYAQQYWESVVYLNTSQAKLNDQNAITSSEQAWLNYNNALKSGVEYFLQNQLIEKGQADKLLAEIQSRIDNTNMRTTLMPVDCIFSNLNGTLNTVLNGADTYLDYKNFGETKDWHDWQKSQPLPTGYDEIFGDYQYNPKTKTTTRVPKRFRMKLRKF